MKNTDLRDTKIQDIEIIKLSLQKKRKKKETICCQTKISYYNVFHITSISNRNKKIVDAILVLV